MLPWLPYVKGGAVWADEQHKLTIPLAGVASETTGTRSGYIVGAGLEYAFLGNWSARLEYDYMDIGTERLRFSSAALPVLVNFPLDVEQRLHAVKFALNYRFGVK